MFLHIGADKEVLVRDIVSIINIASVKQSKIMSEFINISEEDGFIRRITKDEPKSIVIVEEKGQHYLYYSPINSTTLQNRLYSNDYINYIN